MKELIVIEIDENHFLKEMNELYDRLYGRKCELKPMPSKQETARSEAYSVEDYRIGWNACVDAITGETE